MVEKTAEAAGLSRSPICRLENLNPPRQPAFEEMEQSKRAIDFSLFYFGSDADDRETDKYRMLLEGAQFADAHGFSAVWTPERHFHSVGGLYPNPSLTSAAVAMVTKRIAIRAGSVVLPLHHPVRVAEEWALVDNLSRGRAGLSFASGWHPNDFAIAADHFTQRKEIMAEGIGIIRRLWRGESLATRNGNSEPIEIKIFPRPLQKELPVWLTSSGNADTFKLAGELGCNLLTHLFGQSLADLAKRIEIYRKAWRDAGHGPKEGIVTVMMHTFLGEDAGTARAKARPPLRSYLRTYREFSKGAASASTTTVRKKEPPSDAELEVLLNNAVDRYLEGSGLFGRAEDCLPLIDKLRAMGTNEIACLIDFGVDVDSVLASLPWLNELRLKCQGSDQSPLAERSRIGNTSSSLNTPRKERLVAELRLLLTELTNRNVSDLEAGKKFLALGFESLLLARLASAIETKFKVRITFRQFFGETDSLEKLAAYLDNSIPTEKNVEDRGGRLNPSALQSMNPRGLPPAPQHDGRDAKGPPFEADRPLHLETFRQWAELQSSIVPDGVTDVRSYPGLVEGLNEFCATLICEYFASCGIKPDPTRPLQVDELRSALRLRPGYERFLSFMLAALDEDGFIHQEGQQIQWLKKSDQISHGRELHARLAEQFPNFRGLLEMLDHCARNYRQALAGEILGAAVLLPDGRHDFLRQRLQDYTDHHKYVRFYEERAKDLVLRLTERAPLRILEVGGGGGELTWQLAPALAGRGCQYHFSDLGRTLVWRARDEAERRKLDFMTFGVLDISRDPIRQGHEIESFDLILALNVVHATARVQESLAHLRQLLAPGGLICLVELTRYWRWDTMIIGLAEGWWLFDDEHRSSSPLLGVKEWGEAFRGAGYSSILAWPPADLATNKIDASLIVAQP